MGTLPLPTFTYASPDHPSLSITPATVTAGIDTMIEVDGFNTNFAEGQTVIGFGSSDVAVRRTWIIDRGKALLNISVNSGATAGLVTVTAATGVQAVTLNAGLQILPAASQQISLRAPVLNLATGLPGVPDRRHRGRIRHRPARRSGRLDAHHRRRESGFHARRRFQDDSRSGAGVDAFGPRGPAADFAPWRFHRAHSV